MKNVNTRIRIRANKCVNFLCAVGCQIEKKVVFDSFRGKKYSDNPKAISEKLHDIYPEYKIVWALPSDSKEVAPDYVKIYDAKSFRFRRERATAFVYVRNEAFSEDIYKRKGQLFIQTWHGDRGIKKILYDAWENGERPNKVMDEELTDLFVLGSDYAEKRIKTAFRYTGRIIKTGCPRNDCLFNPNKRDEICAAIGIDTDKHILLYAPTLRISNKIVQATVDLHETLRHFEMRGGDWICLVRAHPKSLGIDIKPDSHIIDVSQYPDMADLLMIADALITDYSSCAGDFILKKKPLLLAQFDLEQYMKEERTFYVDINKIGYLIAHTQDELNSYIDNLSDEDFARNCQKVLDYFGTCETGHAAEDVCRLIDDYYPSGH